MKWGTKLFSILFNRMKLRFLWKGRGKMDREELAELCDARDKLCAFCENDNCEKCQVTLLIDQAYVECEDDEDV